MSRVDVDDGLRSDEIEHLVGNTELALQASYIIPADSSPSQEAASRESG